MHWEFGELMATTGVTLWLLTKWRGLPAPLRAAFSAAVCAMVGMAISEGLFGVGKFLGAGVGALAYILVLVRRDFNVP